ncbi:MAG: Methyltransferase type 11 [Thermoleophilia bacterium]|nr:Methyltransferase type 11 [Thermoleophilia bacterium]
MDSSGSTMLADVDQNERYWDEYAQGYHMGHAVNLPTDRATWSVFGLLESELGALGPVEGRDVLELGCGGAQFAISLARAGARCTGVDLSREQLALAARLLAEAEAEEGAGLDVQLVQADVARTGLADASFDVAFSDYGASMFADPLLWVPEAARVLRPGGRLAFSTISPLLETCWPSDQSPVDGRLVRDYFGMHRIEGRAVYFNLPYGDWVRLFRRSGFDIVDMLETRPPEGVETTAYRSANQVAWARRWPAETIWVLDRR